MSHARETIRKAIVTSITGLTTTGTRVYSNYMYPYEDSTLPNLSLYVAHEPEEVADDLEMGTHDLRSLPFRVSARAKANSDLDDSLDDMCAEVETAIIGNAALAAYVKTIQLVSTTIEMDNEGEKPVGVARMEWVIIYRVNRTAPTTPVQ